MLDQPMLSFKSMNTTGAVSEGANTTASDAETATVSEDINLTGNTEATHKFAEVLKDTQTKMRSKEPDVQGKSTEPTVSELINIDLPKAVDLSSTPLVMRDIGSSVLNSPFTPSSEVDTELVITDERLDAVLIEDTKLVPSGVLSITAIEPIDKGVPENRLSPLIPAQAQAQENNKPLLQVINPLADEEPVLQTPKLKSTTTDVPLQVVTTQASLAGAGNKGQFLQQLDKVVVESLVDGEEPSMDVDILKSLGLSAQTPMSTQASSNSPANNPLTVTIPFQQAHWGNAVAEKVMWLSHQGLQEAEIQLDPPELGPLQVKISVENDQAHVSFVVQHSNVKEALEQTATRLREMFEEEGIDLLDVDVSDQSEQQEDGEALAGSLPDETELTDKQTEQQGDTLVTSYISSNNGIDAYV